MPVAVASGRLARAGQMGGGSGRVEAVDGGDRHPSGPRSFQWWCDVPRDRGGPYGRTKGAKRIVAVDVCGLPLAARVVPASTPEATTVELLLEDMAAAGQDERLELVLVDRGTSKRSAARLSARFGVDVRPVGWDTPQLDATGRRVFRPIRHAWRVEVAHGLLGRRRRLAKSFENTMASGTG
jgi:hypothetical protein